MHHACRRWWVANVAVRLRNSSTSPCGDALFAVLDCVNLFQSSPVQHIDRFICNADEMQAPQQAYTSVSAEKDGLLWNITSSEETYCILWCILLCLWLGNQSLQRTSRKTSWFGTHWFPRYLEVPIGWTDFDLSSSHTIFPVTIMNCLQVATLLRSKRSIIFMVPHHHRALSLRQTVKNVTRLQQLPPKET